MNIDATHYQNWMQDELEKFKDLGSYSQASEFAMAKLKALPQPVVQVCGPLTTGGKGSFEVNIDMMHKGICILSSRGKIIFDQRPFEIPMFKILQVKNNSGYDYSLLEEFYLPLFESCLIQEFYFLPGWQSSTGAKWEYDQAQRLGIKIFYFSESLLDKT